MKKNEKILIGVDLDGTLLNNDAQLSLKTKEIIAQLQSQGHWVIPSTSRSQKYLPESLLDTEIRYYVCSNGAILFDRQTNMILNHLFLPSSCVQAILHQTKDINKVITIISDGLLYSEKGIIQVAESQKWNPLLIEKIKKERILLDDFTDSLDQLKNITKVHFNFDDLDEKEKCLRILNSRLDIHTTSSDKSNIEITHSQATKGAGIKTLCSILDINPNKIIGIGNNWNDLPLLDIADIKVAMKNSDPELFDSCTAITDFDNDEDGVALFLEKLLLQ